MGSRRRVGLLVSHDKSVTASSSSSVRHPEHARSRSGKRRRRRSVSTIGHYKPVFPIEIIVSRSSPLGSTRGATFLNIVRTACRSTVRVRGHLVNYVGTFSCRRYPLTRVAVFPRRLINPPGASSSRIRVSGLLLRRFSGSPANTYRRPNSMLRKRMKN